MRVRTLVLATLGVCVAGIDYSARNADLSPPPSHASSDGTLRVDLALSALEYNAPSGASFWTRGFDGAIPGPTLRVRAGDAVHVTLSNELGANGASSTGHNELGDVNTTNLHTHGLHVSSAAPADSVFVQVEPGESFEYEYAIPAFHMGGTHWYHPHHHGSTAVQAGGGAAGMLIVEDAPGELPPELGSLEEVVLVLTHVDTEVLAGIERRAGGELHRVSGEHVDAMLANGQFEPVVRLRAGRWYRWRTLYAAVESRLELALPGCEIGLLAKDGVYLAVAPRAVETVLMYPGARADYALRCRAAGSYSLRSGGERGRALQGDGRRGGRGGGGGLWTGSVLSVEVSGEPEATADLPSFAVTRPCYLVDLTGSHASASVASSFEVALGGGRQINGERFAPDHAPITELAVGAVHEWTLRGVGRHPFHLHINPFQITRLDPGAHGYLRTGDWHDTLLTPGGDGATVRFQADTFVGEQVLHCHRLEHEDEGMMAVAEITGTPGTTWAGAEQVDATCYRGAGGRGFAYVSEGAAAAADVPLLVGLSAGGAVGLALCGAGAWWLLRRRRRQREAGAARTPAEPGAADAPASSAPSVMVVVPVPTATAVRGVSVKPAPSPPLPPPPYSPA